MPKGIWKRTEYHKKLARKQAKKIDLIARGKKISLGRLGNHYPKAAEAKRKEKNPQWTGENPSYSALHKWMIRNFGKANQCENPFCPKISKTYDYALIKGKEYKRLRKYFLMLCRSCHIKYDRNDEQRKY